MTTPGKESTESTGFLYPFIESEETDAGSLLEDLSASARMRLILRKTRGDRVPLRSTHIELPAGRLRMLRIRV